MQAAIEQKTDRRTKTEVGKKELKKARKMIDRALSPLAAESRARNKLGEVTTMRPVDLCSSQGKDVVSRL